MTKTTEHKTSPKSGPKLGHENDFSDSSLPVKAPSLTKTEAQEACGEEEAQIEQEKVKHVSTVIVTPDEAGMRLDRWFKKRFSGLSQGPLQKMLRKGEIRVDKRRVDSDTRLEAGQVIRIPPQLSQPWDSTPRASYDKGDADLAPPSWKDKLGQDKRGQDKQIAKLLGMILYQDDDVVAINKPSGLAVQGGTGLKENLDDMLMVFSRDGVTKPKLVHRLDRDTSGVLLIARTDFAARRLTEAFRMRETQKIYWAATLGVPKPLQGKIEAALAKNGEVMEVVSAKDHDAKKSATLFKVLENANKQMAFVALWPLTGRTHQLRVHMAYIGTPVLGDRLYGGEKETSLPINELGAGLHLHARRLIIPHPRRGTLDVTAPLGPEMLKTWRWFHFDEQADVDFSDV